MKINKVSVLTRKTYSYNIFTEHIALPMLLMMMWQRSRRAWG